MNRKKFLMEKLKDRVLYSLNEGGNSTSKVGEKWFYENPCIVKQFPNITLDGAVAKYESSNRLYQIEHGGLFVVTIKPSNVNRFGRWWCNPTTKNFEFKINPDGKPIVPTKNATSSSPIPQAKTMDDVKNGKGYIIKGMRGPLVKELQKILLTLKYDLGTSKDDSIFGENTKKALEQFQKDNGITPKNNVYGVFGKITYEKMMEKLNNL
jgi:peptidoglycan hydrolase-like protein with peptidoglycan-binding domain